MPTDEATDGGTLTVRIAGDAEKFRAAVQRVQDAFPKLPQKLLADLEKSEEVRRRIAESMKLPDLEAMDAQFKSMRELARIVQDRPSLPAWPAVSDLEPDDMRPLAQLAFRDPGAERQEALVDATFALGERLDALAGRDALQTDYLQAQNEFLRQIVEHAEAGDATGRRTLTWTRVAAIFTAGALAYPLLSHLLTF